MVIVWRRNNSFRISVTGVQALDEDFPMKGATP